MLVAVLIRALNIFHGSGKQVKDSGSQWRENAGADKKEKESECKERGR